ncbi:trypsin-like peptidase domain-containing protein [Actinosynnema sp. NPDC059335]|uniref:trypsin-like peptidase domain-containing protein n=1 Tax=Actinosynnema sp. NPDC059335 TaxID=3346804 RepID=UPI00366F3911
MGFERERRRWRVRLSDDVGRVFGAGTMLDEWHLLTCAHVVEGIDGPRGKVVVDFVGMADAPPGVASVVDEGWVPPTEHERGDIALLRLEKPEPAAHGAPLHRMPLRDHQLVRAYGFPFGAEDGMWTLARLVGEGGPAGEWVQLQRTGEAEPIGQGYSGTAVLDEATGYVIGMVVSRYTGDGGRVGWMIPVETMLGHLPRLAEWVPDGPAVDDSFVDHRTDAVDVPFARELSRWFATAGAGAVWVVVTGEYESATARALRLVVASADRERSVRLPGLPEGVDERPRVGSVDLAVDASGKTADEVRRRIEERFAVGAPAGRTVVVDGIDDAAEPDRLVEDVLFPLADRAAELGDRLVLGFRRETSPQAGVVRATSGAGTSAEPGFPGRLAALDRSVADLAAIEEHQLAVGPRFAGVVLLPPRARRLRSAVNQLRSAWTAGDTAWAERHAGGCERAVTAALDQGRRHRAALDELVDRRAALRARLDSYAEMARDHGLVEERGLDEAYGRAWRLLYDGPCDIAAAGRAVVDYMNAVRHGIGGR